MILGVCGTQLSFLNGQQLPRYLLHLWSVFRLGGVLSRSRARRSRASGTAGALNRSLACSTSVLVAFARIMNFRGERTAATMNFGGERTAAALKRRGATQCWGHQCAPFDVKRRFVACSCVLASIEAVATFEVFRKRTYIRLEPSWKHAAFTYHGGLIDNTISGCHA
jgi:hypothetical protein